MNANSIEFTNVWKKFRKGEKATSLRDAIPKLFSKISNNPLSDNTFWAVQDVSFEVKKGEILGIIGPNGAGKSTILKILAGVMKPNKGSMRINGRLSALIEVGAGFHPDLTGRENVYLNGSIMNMSRKEIDKKFDSIVAFSGLEEFLDTPVKRYSSGMFARLGFAVAAHIDPDVLLVDEVLSVGDMAFQAKCAERIKQLRDSGTSIVFISHNLLAVQNICSRAVLLMHGKIEKTSTPDDVISLYHNYVYNEQEQNLKNKLIKQSDTEKSKESHLVEIKDVALWGGNSSIKKQFDFNEDITVKIHYFAKTRIKRPVFSLSVIRSDGINCFSSDTRLNGAMVEEINGGGIIEARFNKLNLGYGIYSLNTSIWDENMIAPYAVRRTDTFKINTDGALLNNSGVFVPEVEWRNK